MHLAFSVFGFSNNYSQLKPFNIIPCVSTLLHVYSSAFSIFFPFVLVTSFWQVEWARGIGGSPWILNIGGSFQSLLESTVKLFFLGKNLEVKGDRGRRKAHSYFISSRTGCCWRLQWLQWPPSHCRTDTDYYTCRNLPSLLLAAWTQIPSATENEKKSLP